MRLSESETQRQRGGKNHTHTHIYVYVEQSGFLQSNPEAGRCMLISAGAVRVDSLTLIVFHACARALTAPTGPLARNNGYAE